MGLGRSDGGFQRRQVGTGYCKAGRRVSWAPRKEAVLQEKGNLAAGGVVLHFIRALKGDLSPGSLEAYLPFNEKRKQKVNYFHVIQEVVLKQKSICLTKATFLL